MLIALTLQLLGCIWYVKAELENHTLISQPWTFSPYPFFPIQFLRICLQSVKPFLLPKGWLHHHELVWQSRLFAAPVTIHRPTLLFLFECHGMVPSSKGFCLAFFHPQLCVQLSLQSSLNIAAPWELWVCASELLQYNASILGPCQLWQGLKNWEHKVVLMSRIKFCTWQIWSHLQSPIITATEKANVR